MEGAPEERFVNGPMVGVRLQAVLDRPPSATITNSIIARTKTGSTGADTDKKNIHFYSRHT
eukprot:SAG11_NODE_15438_length_578_cov_1.177453_1_plen_60_part_10